jgi:DNA-directed RNA polymerase subunit L
MDEDSAMSNPTIDKIAIKVLEIIYIKDSIMEPDITKKSDCHEISYTDFVKLIYDVKKNSIGPTFAKFELSGNKLNIAVINAIRRVLTDEIIHYYLTINSKNMKIDTNDVYINLPQLEFQISQIPLCYSIPKSIIKDIQFDIDIVNNEITNKVINCGYLKISGIELTHPIFDPTFKLCVLSSGCKLSISNIKIVQATGRQFSGANLTSNAIHKPIDIEDYSLDEMNRAENRLKTFSHGSGYKIPSLLAKPKKFELQFNVRATTSKYYIKEIDQILNDTCDNIIFRLRNILMYISKEYTDEEDGIQSAIGIQPDNTTNRYIITIPNETHTIGNLIIVLLLDIYPQCPSATYSITFEKNLEIVIIYEEGFDIYKYVSNAIKSGIALYNEIKIEMNNAIKKHSLRTPFKDTL